MLSYNTQLKRLVLPEYGRNIQRMVDHCLTIEDRDERTRCAYSIVTAMASLVPAQGNNADYRHKLWDHLAIMSDFKLDIDYPCEIVDAKRFESAPDPLNLETSNFAYRHYGRLVEHLVERAASYPEGPERDALILLLANHMKKLMLAVNPDGVEDAKVFRDLAELSHGQILLHADTTRLHEFKQAAPVQTGKKKKKKQQMY